MYWEQWNPFFFTGMPPEAREEFAGQLRAKGTPILRQPHVWLTLASGAESVLLNAAALMEGFALLVEVNHTYNALAMNMDEVIKTDDILSSGNEYLAAVILGSELGAFQMESMIPTVAICIDLALMYDPFVLFNSPNLEAPGPGVPPDRYPGETFVLACQSAATIDPIRKWEDAELTRFYSELCHSMKSARSRVDGRKGPSSSHQLS